MTCRHFKYLKYMKIPYIKSLEDMTYGELDLAMETGAAKSFLAHVNLARRLSISS